MKVARQLKRNSVGFEIIRDLEKIIKKKTGFASQMTNLNDNDVFEIIERKSGKFRFVTIEYIEKKKSTNKKEE